MMKTEFRAWNVHEKKMYYSTYDTICEIAIDLDGNLFVHDSYYRNWVKDFIISQYTTIDTIHGEKIYKDDVVKDRFGNVYLVTSSVGVAGFLIRCIETGVECIMVKDWYELLGNIHKEPNIIDFILTTGETDTVKFHVRESEVIEK